MLKTTLTLACAIVALAFTTNANAQDCGSCGPAVYSGCGSIDTGVNNCGREISNQGAAGLWAGYCTENCGTAPSRQRCKLFGGNRGGCGAGLGNKFGYPGGCNNGCFGYPSACGGCGGGAAFGGFGNGGGCSLFSKLKGLGGGCSLFSKSSNCGLGYGAGFGTCGGCGSSCGLGGFNGFGLLAKLKSHSGCNLFSKCKGRRSKYAAIASCPVTAVAVDQCGCGNSGQYFNYAVGAEYGTAGMQSGVSQILSGSSCCGSVNNSVLDAGVQSYDNTGAAAITQ